MENKNLIPANFSLDDLAAYLDGEKSLDAYSEQEQAFLKAVDAGQLVLEEKEYVLSRTLNIQKPLTIDGNGAVITGALPPMTSAYIGGRQGTGFYVKGSHVTFQNFTMKNFICAVDLDPFGRTMEDITMNHLTIDLKKIGFQFGSSLSGGILRHVYFQDCLINCEAFSWEGTGLEATLPFTGGAAFARENTQSSIENCLLEDIWFERNVVKGQVRAAINLIGSSTTLELIVSHSINFRNITMRGLHFIGNTLETNWDGPINIIAACYHTETGIAEDIEIAENKMGHGISGTYLYAAEPLAGTCSGAVVRNVTIRDNEITRVIEDVGEPTRGIYLSAVRQDYFEGVSVEDALMENIQIYRNTFNGAGPVICGIYTMLDGKTHIANNMLRNVEIHDNVIKNADYAFTFKAAELEGRRCDWNFGYPRHDQQWLPLLEYDSEILVEVTDNCIENLTCENNQIEGYRYRVFAAGADCRGHGIATGNKLCKNIIFRNNTYGKGEGHVRVADYFGEDFCIDGGGNEVDLCFKKK